METKHTKGEWVWFYNKYYHEVRGLNSLSPNIAIFKNTREDHPKLDDIDICEHEEAEANAKLIAAAPDMLASLQEMIDYYIYGKTIDSDELIDLKNRAFAAIKKTI